MSTAMLHQNGEKSKQEKEGQQRFMGAVKTLGIAALLWQRYSGLARNIEPYIITIFYIIPYI